MTSDYYLLGLQIPDRVFVSGSRAREGYTGHELDPETGNYYAGARYYLPELGRWNATDPHAAMYPDQSPFGYAYNNPLSYMDPLGLDPCREMYPDDESAPAGECYDGGEAVVEGERPSAFDLQLDFYLEYLRWADRLWGLSDAINAVENMEQYSQDFNYAIEDRDMPEILCSGRDIVGGMGDMAGFVENTSLLAAAISSETVAGPLVFGALASAAQASGILYDSGLILIDWTQVVTGNRTVGSAFFNTTMSAASMAPVGRANEGLREGIRDYLVLPVTGEMGDRILQDPCDY